MVAISESGPDSRCREFVATSYRRKHQGHGTWAYRGIIKRIVHLEIEPRPMVLPSASILIVNFNSGHHLKTCLVSLQQQTREDFEVIVLDLSLIHI